MTTANKKLEPIVTDDPSSLPLGSQFTRQLKPGDRAYWKTEHPDCMWVFSEMNKQGTAWIQTLTFGCHASVFRERYFLEEAVGYSTATIIPPIPAAPLSDLSWVPAGARGDLLVGDVVVESFFPDNVFRFRNGAMSYWRDYRGWNSVNDSLDSLTKDPLNAGRCRRIARITAEVPAGVPGYPAWVKAEWFPLPAGARELYGGVAGGLPRCDVGKEYMQVWFKSGGWSEDGNSVKSMQWQTKERFVIPASLVTAPDLFAGCPFTIPAGAKEGAQPGDVYWSGASEPDKYAHRLRGSELLFWSMRNSKWLIPPFPFTESELDGDVLRGTRRKFTIPSTTNTPKESTPMSTTTPAVQSITLAPGLTMKFTPAPQPAPVQPRYISDFDRGDIVYRADGSTGRVKGRYVVTEVGGGLYAIQEYAHKVSSKNSQRVWYAEGDIDKASGTVKGSAQATFLGSQASSRVPEGGVIECTTMSPGNGQVWYVKLGGRLFRKAPSTGLQEMHPSSIDFYRLVGRLEFAA